MSERTVCPGPQPGHRHLDLGERHIGDDLQVLGDLYQQFRVIHVPAFVQNGENSGRKRSLPGSQGQVFKDFQQAGVDRDVISRRTIGRKAAAIVPAVLQI